MRETVKKIWFYLFIGKILFFYMILYFPREGEIVTFNQVLYDLFISTLLSLSTFIGLYTIIYLDEKSKNKVS